MTLAVCPRNHLHVPSKVKFFIFHRHERQIRDAKYSHPSPPPFLAAKNRIDQCFLDVIRPAVVKITILVGAVQLSGIKSVSIIAF